MFGIIYENRCAFEYNGFLFRFDFWYNKWPRISSGVEIKKWTLTISRTRFGLRLIRLK